MASNIKRKLFGNLLLSLIVLCLIGFFAILISLRDPWEVLKRLSTITGVILFILFVLGFVLPRKVGQKTGIERAKSYQKYESGKWTFHSIDRAGPWVNYIVGPVVVDTRKADIEALPADLTFYSEWLAIENSHVIVNPGESTVDKEANTVSYDLSARRTYVWDGCTPKVWFYWFLLIGTPDWYKATYNITTISYDKETKVATLFDKSVFWQLAHKASFVHDAFYQYLDSVPVEKKYVDRLFESMLIESGMPWLLAKIYYFAVRLGGGRGTKQARLAEKSPFTCDSFQQLYTS